jgi:hypothetical protein
MFRTNLAALALLATPTQATDFVLNEQDQVALSQICEFAARSPALPIETNAQVAQVCVQWKGRMLQAKTQTESEPAKVKEQKPAEPQ